MTDLTREVRCRRTVTGYDDQGNERDERCDWRGPPADFGEHTAATGHKACTLCSWPLADDEAGACGKCLDRIRDDLTDIENGYATLPTIVEHSGYRMGGFPGGNALAMLADGNVDGLRSYNPPPAIADPVQVEHAPIPGHDPDRHIDHPGYTEIRLPSDGREHFHDHWQTDPVSVVAALEAIERDWRHALNHGPAEQLATVSGSVGYLRRWLTTAAANHDTFADTVSEIRQLASRIQHAAGLADDPDPASAECFDCGGRLQRPYRPLRRTLAERLEHAAQATAADDRRIRKHVTAELKKHPDREDRKRLRVPARTTRVRHSVAGDDREGRTDTLICASCGRTYDASEYGFGVRMRANSIEGWVSVRVAAETLRRPEQTLWTWIREQHIAHAVSVTTRRVVVDWEEVKRRSDEVGRRDRKKARNAS